VEAAAKLVRQGRPPSVPDAAAEALVSVATAYRYFSRAEDLWAEASLQATDLDATLDQAHRRIEASGDDVIARAEAAARAVTGRMLDDQVPYRRLAQSALEQWFAQQDQPPAQRAPVRAGRRTTTNRLVLEPLRGTVPEADFERIVRAMGLVSGTDAALALTDALGLEGEEAMATLLDATRWLLKGALVELGAERPNRPDRRRAARR
jgi:hypothetical protein